MTTTIGNCARFALGLLLILPSVKAAELELLWEAQGFKNPESVAYDAERELLFVSNIDGVPTHFDAKGGLAKLSIEGEVQDANWAAIGMSSPAGVLVAGDHLYVADVDRVVVFDIEAGRVSDIFYAKPSARFLNDIAMAPNGDIYVSDLQARDIWRLTAADRKSQTGAITRWFNGNRSDFCRPNGLHAGETALIVACWSQRDAKQPDDKDDGPGHLMAIDYEDRSVTSLGDGSAIGNLDGLQPDGQGGFYLSDWTDGRFMHWRAENGTQSRAKLAPGVADFLVIPEREMLIVPFMKDNVVRAYRLPAAKPTKTGSKLESD